MAASDRRAETRAALIRAAEDRIAENGLASLRARDLAADVGCAVGTIYTLFSDLEALVLEVNGRTFRDLGAYVIEAVARETDPTRQLIEMGHAYARFAAAEPRRWSAVFDVAMGSETPPPDWYLQEIRGLFGIIAGPLGALRSDLEPGDVALLTRALFASVHGIVRLSVEGRVSAVAPEEMPRAIELLVGAAARSAPGAEPSKEN